MCKKVLLFSSVLFVTTCLTLPAVAIEEDIVGKIADNSKEAAKADTQVSLVIPIDERAQNSEEALKAIVNKIEQAQKKKGKQVAKCKLDKEKAPKKQQASNTRSVQFGQAQQAQGASSAEKMTACNASRFIAGLGSPALQALGSSLEEDLMDPTNPDMPMDPVDPGVLDEVVDVIGDVTTDVQETIEPTIVLVDNVLDETKNIKETLVELVVDVTQTPLPLDTLGQTVNNTQGLVEQIIDDLGEAKDILKTVAGGNLESISQLSVEDLTNIKTATDLLSKNVGYIEVLLTYAGETTGELLETTGQLVPLQTLAGDLSNTTSHLNVSVNTALNSTIGSIGNINNSTLVALADTLGATLDNLKDVPNKLQDTGAIIKNTLGSTGNTKLDNTLSVAYDQFDKTLALTDTLVEAVLDDDAFVNEALQKAVFNQAGNLQSATQKVAAVGTGILTFATQSTNSIASDKLVLAENTLKSLTQKTSQGVQTLTAVTGQALDQSTQKAIQALTGTSKLDLLVNVNIALNDNDKGLLFLDVGESLQLSNTDGDTLKAIDSYLAAYADIDNKVPAVGKVGKLVEDIKTQQAKVLPSVKVNLNVQSVLEGQQSLTNINLASLTENITSIDALRAQTQATLGLSASLGSVVEDVVSTTGGVVGGITSDIVETTQPVTQPVIDTATDVVTGTLETVTDTVSGVTDTVADVTTGVTDTLTNITTPVTSGVTETVTNITSPVTETIGAVTEPVIPTVTETVTNITQPVVPTVTETITNVTQPVVPTITETITQPVIPTVTETITSGGGLLGGVVNTVTETVNQTTNTVNNTVNNTVGGLLGGGGGLLGRR